MGTSERTTLSSVERSYEIVQMLKESDGARVSEVARELDVAKSTAHKHLATLESLGYARNDGGVYYVGMKYLDLGGYARNQTEEYRKAIQITSSIAEETDMRAQFVVEEHGKVVYAHTKSMNEAVRLDRRLGNIRPLHASAGGKAILAHLPEERITRILEEQDLAAETSETIVDRQALRDELDSIRERGYAFNDEETVEGLRAVGAPVIVHSRVVGAISVSGPVRRLKGDLYRETIPDLILASVNELVLDISF